MIADVVTLGEFAVSRVLTSEVVMRVVAARTGKEITADTAAVITNNFYRDGAMFETNIVAGRPVANLRLEYEQASHKLSSQAEILLSSGVSEENVARWAMNQRNVLKIEYRELTPAPMLKEIEVRNLEKYGNVLGPTAEQLRADGKTWADIIRSASRSGGRDLDFSPPGFN